MAKLEEISELLVSEIRDFEEAVKHMEEIQKNKIQLDISMLQIILNQHQQNLSTSISEIEKQLNQMKVKIEEAKLYPKWAIILFVISLTLNFIAAFIFLKIYY